MSRIGRQNIEPSQPTGDAYTCLLNTDFTKDGTRIEGHAYQDVVAFHDLDTDRWYLVLKCNRCGYPSVSWTDSDAPEMISGHNYNQEVGGPA